MEEREEIWINEVLDSTKGMQRAKPSDALFDKILKRVSTREAKIVRLPQLRIAVAAAAVIAILNFVAVKQYTNQDSFASESENETTLISNYNLYE